MRKNKPKNNYQAAMYFIILMGLVSLFSDMTYEGARSITGPFLAFLGANATVVGLVSGLGEFLGYALRFFSGYLSDKTKQYWLFTIIGYFINLAAVPLLAFAGRWEIAAVLLILERSGKALRTPARDAMLSHATNRVGAGWGFGLHEALDQIGAVSGPLIVAAVFFFRGANAYREGFLILGIPVAAALTVLIASRFLYARPAELETKKIEFKAKGLKNAYWLYLTAACLVAAGYADFPLLAYHLKKVALVTPAWIPVFYAAAMAIDAVAALIFGRWFDKQGVRVMFWAVLLSAFFAPFVFLGNLTMISIGVLLWGIGMGAQESIMRAAIAVMVPKDRRGSGYGVFNTFFGLFWFVGSALMGWLYDLHVFYLVGFSMIAQVAALPLFLKIKFAGQR